LLSQLQNMLENLRMAGPGQLPQGSKEAQQMMSGMRDLMQRQRQLLDRSFRAEQQDEPDGMGPGQQPDGVQPDGNGQLGNAATEQDALRHALGEMMRRLGERTGEIPDPLGLAERAMRDAGAALHAGQPGAAVGPQTEALDQLQRAAREVARRMQRQLGGALGGRDDREGSAGNESSDPVPRDPLGRPLPTNGAFDEGDVKIPDWNTLQQSRKILDELRRRAGESSRPTFELDYINRLLQQF
jgi:hypothetical protein